LELLAELQGREPTPTPDLAESRARPLLDAVRKVQERYWEF
jgi:hypothetical protein